MIEQMNDLTVGDHQDQVDQCGEMNGMGRRMVSNVVSIAKARFLTYSAPRQSQPQNEQKGEKPELSEAYFEIDREKSDVTSFTIGQSKFFLLEKKKTTHGRDRNQIL